MSQSSVIGCRRSRSPMLADSDCRRDSAAGYGRQERDLVAILQRRREAGVVGVDGGRERPFVGASDGNSHDRQVPGRRGRSTRPADRVAARSGRRARAAARTGGWSRACPLECGVRSAASSSGSAVAPSIQTSPPSKCSCFQTGAICLTRSIAKRHAANASARCADAAAITTLASPISTLPDAMMDRQPTYRASVPALRRRSGRTRCTRAPRAPRSRSRARGGRRCDPAPGR